MNQIENRLDGTMDISRLMKNLEEVVRFQERDSTVKFLENLLDEKNGINLYGAIVLLKKHYANTKNFGE